jgi:hypothetical protein
MVGETASPLIPFPTPAILIEFLAEYMITQVKATISSRQLDVALWLSSDQQDMKKMMYSFSSYSVQGDTFL